MTAAPRRAPTAPIRRADTASGIPRTGRIPKVKVKPMTPGIPHTARVRAYLAGAVVTLGLTGVTYRAWGLQIDDGEHYAALAVRQHAMTVAIPAPRGDVVDIRGRPLAVSADTDSIWANPREIRDVTETAAKLATVLGGDPRVLEAKLGTGRKFVWIERHVTPEIAKAVRDAKLPGIELAREPRRWYPGGTTAGPVIGRADIDGIGLDGIELAMNDLLTGKRTANKALRDARGRKMFADGMAPTEAGATVQLTIDRSIQAIADAALAESMIANKAKNGVVVVLDVATSRVLAMSSYPTYDPNMPNATGLSAARNRPVTDTYEAGSVMKMFTVAAALDAGVIEPTTEFDLGGGTFVVSRHPIRDTHPKPSGSVGDIIKHSSNVGAAKIAMRLGRDKLYDGLKNFGFATKTGIELPGEQTGLMRASSTWRDLELATIAFGMGMTVTPLQVAAGLAAIGNSGTYHQPRIVDQVVDPDGTVLYSAAVEERQVVSTKTAAQMMVMLESVFEKGVEGGTGAGIDVPGFACGGKTGTAHKWDSAAKQYAPDRYLSSFAGLAPIAAPRLAIVVMIDEPSGGDYFGGKVAGPVFATVASEALRYLGVPGQALPPPPAVPGLPTPDINVVLAGSILLPASWTAAAAAAAVVPVPLRADEVQVPSFAELGYLRAVELARTSHLAVAVSGTGRVVDQQPKPGPAPIGTRVTLRFSDGKSLLAP